MDSYEYLSDDESTWRYQKLPDIDPDFIRELTAIGGLNPHGQPNLRVVKGNEVLNDRTNLTALKYHLGYSPTIVLGFDYIDNGQTGFAEKIEDVPETALVTNTRMTREALGKLRYIIERWTSPQELESEGRFRRRDVDGLLRDFPREGIYETYYIVETSDGKFRHLDGLVLELLKFRWDYDKLPEDERMRKYDEFLAKEKVKEFAEYKEKVQAALDGDYRLPREEMESREEFWAKYDYADEKSRGLY